MVLTEYIKAVLKSNIPESDMVKAAFKDMYPEEIKESWDETVINMAERALNGDTTALLHLLELTRLNAYNEGRLDEVSSQENF